MKTSAAARPVSELKSALEVLETNAATPIVAGELASWLGELECAWNEASAQIHFFAKHTNPRQYEEIATQDPELLPRIELLQAEDLSIEDERSKLNQSINHLAQRASQLEPKENKTVDRLKTFTDELSLFIVRVRKQAVAVQTWYLEAFNRDHGAVD